MNRCIPALLTILTSAALLMPMAHAHGDEDHGDHGQEAAAAPAFDGTAARRLPDGSLWLPKPVQHRLAVRTVRAETAEHALAITLNGRIVADPNAGGKVQATQPGRIEAGPKGLPLPGQKVDKGQVLAWLHPLASSLERGNQIAALAELESQLALAERKLARYAQLEGAIAQKDIEAARFERDALKKRRGAISASVHAPEALRAPVAGTVVSNALTIGQVVDAREVLFEVVDTSRLMVEALAYDPVAAQGLGQASGQLADGRTVTLVPAGAALQLQDQAMPVLFRIIDTPSQLAVGQPVKVTVSTARKLQGLAVPRSALVRNAAGESIVWVHTAAEQFAPRPVQSKPLDAQSMVVSSGLKAGERVVTQGANLLGQVR